MRPVTPIHRYSEAKNFQTAFLRHGGIYRADEAILANRAGPGLPPPVGQHRSPAKERDGRSTFCPSFAMSSGRLILDRVARQHCPSPLHRHPDHKTLDRKKERDYS